MEDILQQKAYDFALRIVKLSEFLHEKKHEFVLSRKVLDSGTNIGLLIEEGKQGETSRILYKSIQLANKEALKTHFCCGLLCDSKLLSEKQTESMLTDCGELQGLLIASIRTAKKNA